MTTVKTWFCVTLLLGWVLPALAQQSIGTPNNAVVPPLVNFSGTLTDVNGKPLTGVVGVTFYLYKDQEGGAPLWMETQNVKPDKSGHYGVMLGSASSSGLPSYIFVAGEARWLGVQVQGQAEQPRVLLLSVPYALKAADAETIGGLPPSAFILAAPNATAGTADATNSGSPGTPSPAIAGSGTTNFLSLWTNSTTLGNSVLFQSGTGSVAKVGINTTTPASTLDVKGGETIRGTLALPATGTATASKGFNSQPMDQSASAFNSSTSKAVTQTFQWQAEPVGNDTSSPSGTLNLLFGSGGATPTETGLKINNKGLFTFAPGQTFPGTGDGTITGVTAGTDLTGGGSSGNVTLNLDTTKVPQLNAANTFTANQTITQNLTVDENIGATSASFGNISSIGVFTGVTGLFQSFTGATTLEVLQQGSTNCDRAVLGTAPATSGVTTGVVGESESSSNFARGVEGDAGFGSGADFGVLGVADNAKSAGIFGQGIDESSIAQRIFSCCPVGVWGDTGSSAGGAAGLVGTADDARAIYLENNSPSGVPTAFMQQDASGKLALQAGGAGGFCTIDTNGHLNCPGGTSTIASIDSGQRRVALYGVQSPQNWFEDFGSGQLSSGAAAVALDSTFVQTVNSQTGYHVFLTPKGDCRGLYVSNETPSSFEVHELGGGQSNVAFDYRIVALRRGYENLRMEDKTEMMAKLKASIPKPLAKPLPRFTPHTHPPKFPSQMSQSAASRPSVPANFSTER
jgi:hypothetical protein